MSVGGLLPEGTSPNLAKPDAHQGGGPPSDDNPFITREEYYRWKADHEGRMEPGVQRAALLEVLGRYPWTHAFDQSFKQDANEPKGKATVLHYYAGMVAGLPKEYRPDTVWVVVEPHPTSGRWHAHGFWAMPADALWDGWWRAAKEHLGATVGWARIWPFHASTRVELAERLDYPTKHAVKHSPTTFWDAMVLVHVFAEHERVRRVRYMWRGHRWFRLWCGGILTAQTKEV